jgi:hypothetical protein
MRIHAAGTTAIMALREGRLPSEESEACEE